jgi:hypothetical protein
VSTVNGQLRNGSSPVSPGSIPETLFNVNRLLVFLRKPVALTPWRVDDRQPSLLDRGFVAHTGLHRQPNGCRLYGDGDPLSTKSTAVSLAIRLALRAPWQWSMPLGTSTRPLESNGRQTLSNI